MKKLFYIATALLLLCTGCKPYSKFEEQERTIELAEMADILSRVHMIEAMRSSNYIREETVGKFMAEVFEEHDITPEEFEQNMCWYHNHLKTLRALYEEVNIKYDAELIKIQSSIYDYYQPSFPSIWTYYGCFPKDSFIISYKDLTPYLELPAAELRTDYRRSYPYIQRLGTHTPYWKIGNE